MRNRKNIDLDRSLEETIKMKQKDTRRNETKRPEPRGRVDITRRTNINNRIGKKVPPLKRRKEEKELIIKSRRPPMTASPRVNVDPSQIVITKTLPRQNTQEKKPNVQRKPKPAVVTAEKKVQKEPTIENSKIVLLCNLDPRATAKDIGDACAMFGPIMSCDLLVDPMGRPLYEAEIEFVYPHSAEQCVAQLDNKVADGRVLRARLQQCPTLPVKPRYSSRTVVASARVAPGGFNDPTPIVSPEYTPMRQTNHPYYQQYQQQFYNKRYD